MSVDKILHKRTKKDYYKSNKRCPKGDAVIRGGKLKGTCSSHGGSVNKSPGGGAMSDTNHTRCSRTFKRSKRSACGLDDRAHVCYVGQLELCVCVCVAHSYLICSQVCVLR